MTSYFGILPSATLSQDIQLAQANYSAIAYICKVRFTNYWNKMVFAVAVESNILFY